MARTWGQLAESERERRRARGRCESATPTRTTLARRTRLRDWSVCSALCARYQQLAHAAVHHKPAILLHMGGERRRRIAII